MRQSPGASQVPRTRSGIRPRATPQQLGRGQVHLADPARPGDGGIGYRGEVIEIGVAVARLIQSLLGGE